MSGIGEALLISAATSLVTAGLTYALSPTQKNESGRINDLTTPKSSYGAPLPWCWGKVRVGGNLIWSTYLEEVKKTTKQGKGAKVQTTNYSYYGSFATIFCDCPFRPLVDIPRVWMNKTLTFSKVGGAETISEGGKFAEQYLRFYLGNAAHNIDPLLQNTEPIQNYSYGLPSNKADRDTYLRSIGINPEQTIFTPTYNHRAFLVAQRLPLGDFFNSLPTIEAELQASNDCTPGQIIGDIFGLFYPKNRFDVSLISTADFACDGFFINSVTEASQAVQNLQKAYFFDIVDSNGVFKFIPLNHPRDIINLVIEDLSARPIGSEKSFDYQVIESDPASLPSEIVVSYVDKDLNYDINEQRSQGEVRNNYNPNILSLDFSIVMGASQAATIADRSFFLALLLTKIYKFQLPTAYLNLEPGDLLPNLFDGSGLIKLNQTRIGANLILDCEAVPHDLSFWAYKRNIESGNITVGVANYNVAIASGGNVNSVASQSGQLYTLGTDYTLSNGNITPLSTGNIPPGSTLVITTTNPVVQQQEDLAVITSPGNTNLLVLDLPLLKDDDPDFTLYLTGDGGSNWNGASIYTSVDNSRYLYALNLNTYGIFGTTVDQLGGLGTTVSVKVNKSELESITNNDLTLGLNLALVGNEIIQFKTAQLTDQDTYLLSDLTRGLRGTENEILSHATGDRFILLTGENAEIINFTASVTDIGQVRYFKAVSSGQTLDQVTPVQITYQGISQRPYAPVNITATKNGVGDIIIGWIRRDRHRVTINNPPLSETTESYVVNIMSNNNTIVRNATSNSNSYTYLATDQIADFSQLRTSITIRIAQVSSSYGNGSFATATLTPIYSEPVPAITGFTPASAEIGATITVTGTDLAQVSAIKIGDINQTNLAVIDNQNITFVLASGTVSSSIKLTTPGGTATSSNALIVKETSILIVNQTYNIPGDFNTIQAAISSFGNKILSNVTLNLGIGDFTENLVLDNFLTMPVGLKITGQGINSTIIKGRININSVESDILIEKLTIQPFITPVSAPGLRCAKKINLTAKNVKIQGWTIGIDLIAGSTADIETSLIQNCSTGIQVSCIGRSPRLYCDSSQCPKG